MPKEITREEAVGLINGLKGELRATVKDAVTSEFESRLSEYRGRRGNGGGVRRPDVTGNLSPHISAGRINRQIAATARCPRCGIPRCGCRRSR